MKYYIFEDNFRSFESKLKTIERKCHKYNFPFSYQLHGEEIRPTDPDDPKCESLANYYVVSVEGKVQFNGWQVVAELEAAPDGNIMRYFTDAFGELPESYRNASICCEHCKTAVRRKYAYVVRDVNSGEYKMVGRSCLKLYTSGLDSEDLAVYMSALHSIEEMQSVPSDYQATKFFKLADYLAYVSACIDKYGWENSEGQYPTGDRAYDLFGEADPAARDLDVSSEAVLAKVDSALQWIRNRVPSEDEGPASYLFKLQQICKSQYTCYRDRRLVASLFVAYDYEMRRIAEEAARAAALAKDMRSQHVGELKQWIEFDTELILKIGAWETQFGLNVLYKMYDAEGNIYIWSTGRNIALDSRYHVRAKVKAHSEFRGVPQTEIFYCKLTSLSSDAA